MFEKFFSSTRPKKERADITIGSLSAFTNHSGVVGSEEIYLSTMKRHYAHQEIEAKWRKRWQEEKVDQADLASDNKFYCLDMFPYPSGDGLHVGHWRGYVLSDFYARYQRLQGKHVLHPMGFDSFGLPAENAAIKHKSYPQKFTTEAIAQFRPQLEQIGASFDWSKAVTTSDPNYYQWTQWLFLQFFKHGLAEKRTALVNWCPKDQTVLANEQVVAGKCDRCGTVVTKKELAQWFLKITDLAEELLGGLDALNWPEHVKTLQRNWIGKSEGAEISFDSPAGPITVFTTRPDTLYGVTAIVVAPEHSLVSKLTTAEQKKAVEEYLVTVTAKTNVDRQQQKETAKTAVFTGSSAVHPLTKEPIPIWVADYVLLDYGTGAVMSVPAHDERDHLFAQTHNLPITEVIEPETGEILPNEEFRQSIIAIVEDPKTGKFLTLNWGKELGGQLFIGGGLDEGEDVETTARREITEETGYTNLEFIGQTGTLHHHYRAYSKNVNRIINVTGLHFRLTNDAQADVKLEDNEVDKFAIEWLTAAQVEQLIVDESHLLSFQFLINKKIYSGAGRLTNSGQFSGKNSQELMWQMAEAAGGKKTTTYRLRDWLVSRQRYWGAPIPIVYDPEGKPHPVKEEHLPLLLPEDVDFLPGGDSPIARSQEYVARAEELYGKGWHFETDTLDTFVDSSWYFLRYLSPTDSSQAFDPAMVKKWLPVDLYIGGIEHAILHLLYARFVTRFLAKYNYIDAGVTEPFTQLFNIGMVNLHGTKMSKSKGNVISPNELVEFYGTDALRGYEMFIGPLDVEVEWNPRGINGVHRFLIKLWNVVDKVSADAEADGSFGGYLAAIEGMIKDFRINTIVSEAMKLVNSWEKRPGISAKEFRDLLITLFPIFPYITAELWETSSAEGAITQAVWPTATVARADAGVKVFIGSKFLGNLAVDANATQEQVTAAATEDQRFADRLSAKKITNVIYKPGAMINFVVSE
jgi:leucyl-tRNA synthetase